MNTREAIGRVTQMTALRFQTGERHQTPLAFRHVFTYRNSPFFSVSYNNVASVEWEPETVGCFILVNVHADLTTVFVHDVKCQSKKKKKKIKKDRKKKRTKETPNGRKMPAPPGRPISESFQNQGKQICIMCCAFLKDDEQLKVMFILLRSYRMSLHTLTSVTP